MLPRELLERARPVRPDRLDDDPDLDAELADGATEPRDVLLHELRLDATGVGHERHAKRLAASAADPDDTARARPSTTPAETLVTQPVSLNAAGLSRADPHEGRRQRGGA